MTHAEERSINIFVDADSGFDHEIAEVARDAILEVLERLEAKRRRPQVREVAAELRVHPRRVVRLLGAFGLRDRCRERVVKADK